MKLLSIIVFFSMNSFAESVPLNWNCNDGNQNEYHLKGIKENSEANPGSFKLVNMATTDSIVLSFGLLGESEADGFVAIADHMDPLTEGMIDRLCPEDADSGTNKTAAVPLNNEQASGQPLCLSCKPF
ncbi:MAG: hypothetical protein AAF203_10825 [Pseudomonadota bacterium]